MQDLDQHQFFWDVCSSAATRSKVRDFKSQARQAFVSSFATLPQMMSCASFHTRNNLLTKTYLEQI
jgi:hypothetical protein